MDLNWELASQIATVLGAGLTVLGLGIVIYQLQLQQKQARLAALDSLLSELDTHEARLARDHIYKSPPARMRYQYLHSGSHDDLRRDVENTLATFERMAYKIITKQVPSQDAYDFYGGVLLNIASKVWPYIDDQRKERKNNPQTHKLVYRRYLETVVKQWIPMYCRAIGLNPPHDHWPTQQKLDYIFPVDESSV